MEDMQRLTLSLTSLGGAVASTLVLVASCASNKTPESSTPTTEMNEPSTPTAEVYEPSPTPDVNEPSTPTHEVTDLDMAVRTIIAIDVDSRLASMCGLPESELFFKYDSAKLLPIAKERMELISTCAKTGAAKGQALVVVGRTDPNGSDENTQQMGKERAESVATYLRELGVKKTQVETESKGDASANEANTNGWPYDRRVTLRLQPAYGLADPQTTNNRK